MLLFVLLVLGWPANCIIITKKYKMKKLLLSTLGFSMVMLFACKDGNESTDSSAETSSSTIESTNTENTTGSESGGMVHTSTYIDLNTSQPIDIIWDSVNNRPLNKMTNQPVELYVNTATRDTIYGPGYIVNQYLINTDGKWTLDDAKIKREGDEIKIKKGNMKFKMEDGEWKMKRGDTKIKSGDDEGKIKTDDGKIKTENGETKIKPDQN